MSAVVSQAHFLLNLNVRIFHVEHTQTGLRVFARTPMPYLVADKLGEAADGALPLPAPFTTNAFEDEALVHFVDFEAIAEEPLGVAQLVATGMSIDVQDQSMTGTVEATRLHRVNEEPGFATLEEARAALSGEQVSDLSPLYVGDAIVDVQLFFPFDGPVSTYALSSSLDPGIPGQENTANLILDYATSDPGVFRSRGLLNEPVVVSSALGAGIVTFVWEGMRHILEGLDHVLFVVCLVIGAQTLHSLLWRVTGFTIGHSVTLATGFFGFVPSGAWFVPMVETGIALSIIYAAAIAIRSGDDTKTDNRRVLVTTIGIGLLHGLGFSFVLQEILQVTSPNIWQSLLAFNVGVEIGQIAIVLMFWPALALLWRMNTGVWRVTRIAISTGCIILAGYWTAERIGMILASV